MQRTPIAPRPDWKDVALAHGFDFHSIQGDPYWDESAVYRFTLEEIEDGLEEPVEELEEMCFSVVERARWPRRPCSRGWRSPKPSGRRSPKAGERARRNLYGRMDFSYDGTGPAKLLEYNADTPTALYESSIFQWVWLEQHRGRHGRLRRGPVQCAAREADRCAVAFRRLRRPHFACAKDSEEDRGTVAYLEDCAKQAGLQTGFVYMDDIGIDRAGRFTDLDDRVIENLFKLYPWEWIMAEEFGRSVPDCGAVFIEPAWKAILSNKGLLALLWEMFEGHQTCCRASLPMTRALPRWQRPTSASRCCRARDRT